MQASSLLVAVVVTAVGIGAHQTLQPRQPDGQENAGQPVSSAAPGPQMVERVDRLGDPLPAGAIARLGTERFRHMHTISFVAYSDDGQRLISSSWDGTVRLWDAGTGRMLFREVDSKEGFSSAAISPDGQLMAGGNMQRTLFLWDAKTCKLIRRIEGLENTVFGLRFSPDSKRLAGVSGNVLHVWEAATGNELSSWGGPKDDIRPFAFSADLMCVALAVADGSLGIWDLATGKQMHRIPTDQPGVQCLAFAPDGKTLVSGGTDQDRTVRLWDISTGKELRRFGPYKGWIESLALAPDGHSLAVGEQFGTIRILDLPTGTQRCQCSLREGSWVRALASIRRP